MWAAIVVFPKPGFAEIHRRADFSSSYQDVNFWFLRIHAQAFLDRLRVCVRNRVWSVATSLARQASAFSVVDASVCLGGSRDSTLVSVSLITKLNSDHLPLKRAISFRSRRNAFSAPSP